jgi:hypothetical protein
MFGLNKKLRQKQQSGSSAANASSSNKKDGKKPAVNTHLASKKAIPDLICKVNTDHFCFQSNINNQSDF